MAKAIQRLVPVPVTGILSPPKCRVLFKPSLCGPEAPYSCWARPGLALAAFAGVADGVGRLLLPHLNPNSRRRPSPPVAAAIWRSRRYSQTPILRRLATGLSSAHPPSASSPFLGATSWSSVMDPETMPLLTEMKLSYKYCHSWSFPLGFHMPPG